eukprot:COSAG06_NODE_4226_length_4451_cov_6.710018_1_plen_186_part_00
MVPVSHVKQPEGKQSFFECFRYVCPEPVLVKCSFIYINGVERPFLLTRRLSSHAALPGSDRLRQNAPFVQTRVVFVPSLSWQMIDILEKAAPKRVRFFCTCDKRGCSRAAVIALALAAEQGVIRRKSGLVAAVATVISGQHKDCVVPHVGLPQLRCEVADADVEHVQRGHVVRLPGPLLPLRRAV